MFHCGFTILFLALFYLGTRTACLICIERKKSELTKKNKDPYHFIFLPEEPGLQLESVDHLLAGLLAVHKALGKPVHILR